MRSILGLTVPLLLLTAAFLGSVPHVAAQGSTYVITGHVLSDQGVPLEGVSVNAYTSPADGTKPSDPTDVRNANDRTDANGSFTLKLAEGNGWINIYYEEWRIGDGRELVVTGDRADVDFTLKTPPPRDAIVEGQVLDINGKPIAGAEVSIQTHCCYAIAVDAQSSSDAPDSKMAMMPPYYDDHRTMKTDEDGRYRFEAYAGPHQIVAWGTGYAQTTTPVDLKAGETQQQDITLEKVPTASAILQGRVVDADTGLPLARAQVSLRSLEWGRYAWAETDGNGEYSVKMLPGWAELTVSHYAYYTEPAVLSEDVARSSIAIAPRAQEYYAHSQILKLANGDNDGAVKLEPKPKPTIVLTGYVLDPDTKKAVQDARVNIWNLDGGDWGEAVTDATGSYKIMVREGRYSATAWKEGHLSGTQTFLVSDKAAQRQDLILPKGTMKYAPCYEADADSGCGGGPIMYSRGAMSEGAYDTKSAPPAAPPMGTTQGTTTKAPNMPQGAPDEGGNAPMDDANFARDSAGNTRTASFAGEGGGLPPYDPNDGGSVPAGAEVSPTNAVPAGGVALGILALAGVAVAMIARRKP